MEHVIALQIFPVKQMNESTMVGHDRNIATLDHPFEIGETENIGQTLQFTNYVSRFPLQKRSTGISHWVEKSVIVFVILHKTDTWAMNRGIGV